ncbi:MAG: hypothetical protein ACYTF6_02100 [Planctomycetota bacterium]|jgi:hypothetical protein
MITLKQKMESRNRGAAYVISLMLLAVFFTIGMAVASVANINLQQSHNSRQVMDARLTAEGGMSFLTYRLCGMELDPELSGQELLDAVATELAAELNGTGIFEAGFVTYDGSTISVPAIATGEHDRDFTAAITVSDETDLHVLVTGRAAAVTRSIGMTFAPYTGSSPVLSFGIASRSRVELSGTDRIAGANNAFEANILSATYSSQEVFNISGNSQVEGDIYASSQDAYATVTNNAEVGGVPGGAGHFHNGIGLTEFPEMDPGVFEPFATNIVSATTPTSGTRTFENIRVLRNTNKVFSGHITFNGVIFIESPNCIEFSGPITIRGVVVTQDAGPNAHATNSIIFSSSVKSYGVETLPDSEFHELRELTGTFLLAPGFCVTLTGSFGCLNGAMAADKFEWSGGASGVIHGPVLSYGDELFTLSGTSEIIIDRSGETGPPAGFKLPTKLAPNCDSYAEY